jgi:hypothetical protein
MKSLVSRSIVALVLLTTLAIVLVRPNDAETQIQGSVVPATRVEVIRTVTRQGAQVSKEQHQGTYFIDETGGRVRIEQELQGAISIQLWNFKENIRYELNVSARTASSRPILNVRAGGSLRPPSGTPPSENSERRGVGIRRTNRFVSGLTLEGSIASSALGSNGTVSQEVWRYRFPDPELPPLLTLEFVTNAPAIGSLPAIMEEQRIVTVIPVDLPDTTFTVPADFTVTADTRLLLHAPKK